MKVRRLVSGVALVGMILPSAAQAEFYSETRGWTIVDTEEGCGAVKSYEGPGNSRLILSKTVADLFSIGLLNDNWSAIEGQSYDIYYALDGKAFGGGETKGFSSSGQKGFSSNASKDFERSLAAARTLAVFLDVKLIDRLSLDGSSAALKKLDQCIAEVRAEKDAAYREEQRWADLPEDPFENSARPPWYKRPYSVPGEFLANYPEAAKTENRGGRTEFSLKIDADGNLLDCSILSSSGYADFDDATCATFRKMDGFVPARDANGKNVAGELKASVNWKPWDL